MSAKDTFYINLHPLVTELMKNQLSVWTTDRKLLFQLAETLVNVLHLQHAEFPLTTGLAKVAGACGDTPVRTVAGRLAALLKTRNEAHHQQKRDSRTGREYTSISPFWWATTKLEAALLFTEEE